MIDGRLRLLSYEFVVGEGVVRFESGAGVVEGEFASG